MGNAGATKAMNDARELTNVLTLFLMIQNDMEEHTVLASTTFAVLRMICG